MIKRCTIILLSISLLFLGTRVGKVTASSQHSVPYYEDHSKRVGYKNVNEAVMEFERDCKCEVKLPSFMPEIIFTHEFASLYKNKINGVNQILQIRFVNRKIKSNNYKIEIRKDKMEFEGVEYSLQGGAKGIYFRDNLFGYLAFEKNNLQYIVGLDRNVGNGDTLKVLIDVANSIN